MSLAPITGVVAGNAAGNGVNLIAVLSFLIILTLSAIILTWLKKRRQRHGRIE